MSSSTLKSNKEESRKTCSKRSTSNVKPTRISGEASLFRPCKCGSTTHFRPSHKDCPLHAEHQKTARLVDESSLFRPCKCGSTTHFRPTHEDCPLHVEPRETVSKRPNSSKLSATPKQGTDIATET